MCCLRVCCLLSRRLHGLTKAGSVAAHKLIDGYAEQQADDLRDVRLPSGISPAALWDLNSTLPSLSSETAPTSTSTTTPSATSLQKTDTDIDDDDNDDDAFGSIVNDTRHFATTVNDFENEYPMRALPSYEAQAARAATNSFIAESYDRLETRLYTPTNVVDEVDVQSRPTYPDSGVRVAHPVELFRNLITLTPKHGPLASLLCDGAESFELTGTDFWHLLCLWVTLATQDCALASKWAAAGLKPLRRAKAGSVRALLLAIPDTEVFAPGAVGCVYDLREWWTAIQSGQPPPLIGPLVQHDERRPMLNSDGIAELTRLAPAADRDMVDMMAVSGFDSKQNTDPRMFLLVPNATAFYEHMGHSVKKVEEELDKGILQGPFHGFPFLPVQVVENSYVVQKGKERRIGRGDAPYNFLWEDQDCSINASIELENFPEMRLPSIFTFAENVAIAQTLHTATGDARHGQEQVYSDWAAFYRWLVPMLFYWWTQCAILHPGGCVADAGTFFGSSASPGLANRCMNVLLWFWSVMVLIVLDKVTTWDVTANGGAGGPCEPGTSYMFAHCGYNDAAADGYMPPHVQRLADTIVADIPSHHASDWDRLDTARQWRQRRYNLAREEGLPMRDCIWNSIPYVFSGFFDDSQQSCAACFVQIIVGCVLRITELTGVKLSAPKLVWARPGLVGSVSLLRAEPRLVSHLAWTFKRGFAVALGREMNTLLWSLFDTQARIQEAAETVQRLIAGATGTHALVSVNELQSLAGLLMFMVMVRKDLRGLLNSVWRCLKRATTVAKTPWHRHRQHRQHCDNTTTLSAAAKEDLTLLVKCLRLRRGYAFSPTTVTPGGDGRPRVFIMNDSAGQSSVEGDTTFRGGGVWIFADGAAETFWSNVAWTPEQLTKHSTETEMANATCSLAALVVTYPGFDFVEVLDSQAAVHTLRRLACRSASLERQVRYRLEVLQSLPPDTRVWTVWSCREEATLADMLSKNDLPGFRRALAARGLPPASAHALVRAPPKF